MPRRTWKIETDEVQGPGSYVVIASVPYGVFRQVRLETEATDTPSPVQEEALARTLLSHGVKEWNWTDENGSPLRLPKDAESLDYLTTAEVMFLAEAVAKQGQQGKNED